MTEIGERVFRGRRDNHDDWYIVDPSSPSPEGSIRNWRARYAPTNVSAIRRVGAGVAGWTAFFLITIGPTSAASALLPPYIGGLVVPVALASFVAGVVVVIALDSKIAPPAGPSGERLLDVVPVEPEVVEWAVHAATAEDLWELNLALRRTRDVVTAYAYWADFAYEREPRPDRVIEETIEPALRVQFVTERAKLLDVSARLGFTPPESTVADLEPMSRYAD